MVFKLLKEPEFETEIAFFFFLMPYARMKSERKHEKEKSRL